MRCCREFDVLCYRCISRRHADGAISGGENHRPRYRYVNSSGSGPACSQDIEGGTWCMRHRKPPLRPGCEAKTAGMPRPDCLGGICGRQRYSGFKNGTEVKCSLSAGATKCRSFSFWVPTTPAALQW
jgi:hypothetical protein